MKVEARIFDVVTVFAFVVAIIYGVWSKIYSGSVEPIGVVALTLTGGLTLLVGTYFRFVARRVDERPEDRPDAEISEGAGAVGFFSPGSYWPIAMAATASLTGLGLAFEQYWIAYLGGIALLMAIGGLVFEYHVGPNEE